MTALTINLLGLQCAFASSLAGLSPNWIVLFENLATA